MKDQIPFRSLVNIFPNTGIDPKILFKVNIGIIAPSKSISSFLK